MIQHMAKKRIGIQIKGPNEEPFIVKARLGSGAFGEVYEATGVQSKKSVAVKLVPFQKLNDPQTLAVRTLLNESRVAMVSNPFRVRKEIQMLSGSRRVTPG